MTPKNQILTTLSPDVFQRLEPHLNQVTLERGEFVHRFGEPMSHLYFPLDCLFSVILTMENGATAEVGMVGSREMLGINALMGDNATTHAQFMAQVAGSAMKIDVCVVQEEFDHNVELRAALLRCAQAFLAQVSQTAACNALHPLEQRLSRWLLGAQERLHSDNLPLTQEFLASMLAVRRAGVTLTAQKLQERKLIQYRRASVQIINQSGLEAFSCECFKRITTEYDRLLGKQ